MNDRLLFILSVSIGVASFLARFSPALWVLSMVVSAIFVTICILTRTFRFRRFSLNNMKVLVIITLLLVEHGVLITDFIYAWTTKVAIQLQLKTYDLCEKKGENVGDTGKLSVCTKDERWWRFGFTQYVVYDSTDNIVKGDPLANKLWDAAAAKLDDVAPLKSRNFKFITLGNHFYRLTFADQPDYN